MLWKAPLGMRCSLLLCRNLKKNKNDNEAINNKEINKETKTKDGTHSRSRDGTFEKVSGSRWSI
jgi:hypothetical protein